MFLVRPYTDLKIKIQLEHQIPCDVLNQPCDCFSKEGQILKRLCHPLADYCHRVKQAVFDKFPLWLSPFAIFYGSKHSWFLHLPLCHTMIQWFLEISLFCITIPGYPCLYSSYCILSLCHHHCNASSWKIQQCRWDTARLIKPDPVAVASKGLVMVLPAEDLLGCPQRVLICFSIKTRDKRPLLSKNFVNLTSKNVSI